MTTEIAKVGTLTPERAALGVERLTHLLPSLRSSPEARAEAEKIIPFLEAPADPVWVAARIAALVEPYYEKNTPQAVREMNARDWITALDGFPRWAIEAACRWWRSAENPKMERRPLEGHIQARARFEMDAVNAARRKLREAPQSPPEPAGARQRVSAGAAAKILEEAGLGGSVEALGAPKRMDGAELGRKHWSDGEEPDSPRMQALRDARAASRIIPIEDKEAE